MLEKMSSLRETSYSGVLGAASNESGIKSVTRVEVYIDLLT